MNGIERVRGNAVDNRAVINKVTSLVLMGLQGDGAINGWSQITDKELNRAGIHFAVDVESVTVPFGVYSTAKKAQEARDLLPFTTLSLVSQNNTGKFKDPSDIRKSILKGIEGYIAQTVAK
jgi:hypothetical protein